MYRSTDRGKTFTRANFPDKKMEIWSFLVDAGNPKLIDYLSTKGAIVSFTRSLAKSLVSHGVRVNAIAPGEIDTSILSPGTDKIVEQIPMQRLGTTDEVAKIIYVLCTDTSSYVNGAEIHINGGQHV